MKKICIIIPYFGAWPKVFDFFLKTAPYNPEINWLFYTDCNIPKNAPKNTFFKYATLEEFNDLASKKLKLKIDYSRPYKICDIRPAFGIIFEDFLKNFDFWGNGDIDLILGNIKKFFTDKILEENDILTTGMISSKGTLISPTGHFTLYRNTPKINNLFRESKDYKKVFLDKDKHYAFDECNEAQHINPDNILKAKTEVVAIGQLIKKNADKGKLSVFFGPFISSDHVKPGTWKILWKNGKVYDLDQKKELAYFHLIGRKNDPIFKFPELKPGKKAFIITPSGIRYLTFKDILKENKERCLHGIDHSLGKIGLFIKKHNSSLYTQLKKLKIKLNLK